MKNVIVATLAEIFGTSDFSTNDLQAKLAMPGHIGSGIERTDATEAVNNMFFDPATRRWDATRLLNFCVGATTSGNLQLQRTANGSRWIVADIS